MEKQKAKQLLTEADALLVEANAESQRSSSAVVTHMVCGSTRKIMHDYLSSYLIEKGGDPEKCESLAGLLEQCLELDPRFEKVDLGTLDVCYREKCDNESVYCLSVEKVSNCLLVANQTKSLIYDEILDGL